MKKYEITKIWVKINSGHIKTDKDAQILTSIENKYHTKCNTQDLRAMWFNFKTDKDAFGFVKDVVLRLPYLTLTIGNNLVDS